MKTLIYKGYIGSVEISDEDNCLFGKVLDLPKDTMISYEGETVTWFPEHTNFPRGTWQNCHSCPTSWNINKRFY